MVLRMHSPTKPSKGTLYENNMQCIYKMSNNITHVLIIPLEATQIFFSHHKNIKSTYTCKQHSTRHN